MMAVTIEKIDCVMVEAKRFSARAKEAKLRLKQDRYASYGCKETGAVIRASMDLSQALADLRKS